MNTGTLGLVKNSQVFTWVPELLDLLYFQMFLGKSRQMSGEKSRLLDSWVPALWDFFRYFQIFSHESHSYSRRLPALHQDTGTSRKVGRLPASDKSEMSAFYLGTTGTFPIMVSPMYKDEVHPTGTGRLQTLERNDPARDKFFTGNLPSQSPRPRYRHFRTW